MSLPIDRATIITAPAIIQYQGVSVFVQDNIVATPRVEYAEIGTSIHGPNRDKRLMNVMFEVTFTPSGQMDNAGTWLHKTFGVWNGDPGDANAFQIGQTIFGAADRTLVIHSVDGRKYTFQAAAPLRPGQLRLKAGTTLFGPITFTCLRKNNTAWATANSLVQIQTGQAFPAVTFSPTAVSTCPWSVSDSGGRFANLPTMDGITLEIAPDVLPISVDTIGTADYRLRSLRATVRFRPAQVVDVIALLGVQGTTDTGRGASVSLLAADELELLPAGSQLGYGFSLSLPKCALTEGPNEFGAEVTLNGEMTFESVWTPGQPVFQITEI